MKQWHKFLAAIVGSVIVTFLGTAYVVHKYSTKSAVSVAINASIEMEALNDTGRVEVFDFVEDMIKKGCTKEALEFVNDQKSSLLYGLQYHMQNNEALKAKVLEHNQQVGKRAIRLTSYKGSYTYPTCK